MKLLGYNESASQQSGVLLDVNCARNLAPCSSRIEARSDDSEPVCIGVANKITIK